MEITNNGGLQVLSADDAAKLDTIMQELVDLIPKSQDTMPPAKSAASSSWTMSTEEATNAPVAPVNETDTTDGREPVAILDDSAIAMQRESKRKLAEIDEQIADPSITVINQSGKVLRGFAREGALKRARAETLADIQK